MEATSLALRAASASHADLSRTGAAAWMRRSSARLSAVMRCISLRRAPLFSEGAPPVMLLITLDCGCSEEPPDARVGPPGGTAMNPPPGRMVGAGAPTPGFVMISDMRVSSRRFSCSIWA